MKLLQRVASFPGPAQLSIAISTVKRRKAGRGLGTRLLGACVCPLMAMCMLQTTATVKYKSLILIARFLTSSRGKEQVHFNIHKQWHSTKWKFAYCRLYFKMYQSLHSWWKLHMPVWKWPPAGFSWNCSRPRWLLPSWRLWWQVPHYFWLTGKSFCTKLSSLGNYSW